MQVSNTLQLLFSQLAGQARHSSSAAGGRSLAGPHVQLSLGNQSGFGHLFYTSQGKALQLGSMVAATSRGQEITGRLTYLLGEEVFGKLLSLSRNHDAIVATLLQQSFQIIKEEINKDHRKKRRQKQAEELFQEIEQSTEGEEQALELLENLLEYASDAEDLIEFTGWARESINRIEAELRERTGKLSEERSKTFSIMRDALEALEHGMTPEYILDRLEAEIDRKKDD